jgi:hypothetical protein
VQSGSANLRLGVDVVNTLAQRVRTCFGDVPESVSEDERAALREYGEDALRTFTKIQPEYQRLGLDNPIEYQQKIAQGPPEFLGAEYRRYNEAALYIKTYAQMEDFVEYWGRNVLPEYIRSGHELDGEIKDDYFEDLQDKLCHDVDYILSMQMDDRTRIFGKELARAKVLSLTRTLEQMSEPDTWYASAQNKKLVEEQLARLRPVVDVA